MCEESGHYRISQTCFMTAPALQVSVIRSVTMLAKHDAGKGHAAKARAVASWSNERVMQSGGHSFPSARRTSDAFSRSNKASNKGSEL
jgi:hypothetical protein